VQAVRAEPNLAEAQQALGYVQWILEWDWPAAEAAFRRAVTLDPSNATSHRMLGHALSQAGRQAEATAAMRRARDLDPLSALNHALSSHVAFQGRDYAAAVEHARQAVLVDPDFWIGYIQQGQVYEQQGKVDLALEALSTAARLSNDNSKVIAVRAHVLATMGRPKEARVLLRTLERLSRERYVPPYASALVHAGLGERDAALDWLDRAYAVRDVHLIFLPVDPKWDAFRGNARFQALLARCDFMRENTRALR
jgi:Flp pilus assembly protein TadD